TVRKVSFGVGVERTFHHPLELRLLDEVVVHSVDLPGTGRARGRGHAEVDLGRQSAHFGEHARLADAGGAGYDGEPRLGPTGRPRLSAGLRVDHSPLNSVSSALR